ncbi:MAG: nuclear transport factor 2 family protein [Acidobacteriota bacterium]|nr:nuclear transport factor 2 family protein [Acidobacteriota bacterium]
MTRGTTIVLTLIGAVLAMAPATWAQPVQSTQDVLIELERGWNDAVYRQDADFVAGLLADEFIVTYDDGTRGDKARELELVAAFNQAVVSSVQDNFTVQVYDDTAVVWFTLNLVGLRQGQEVALTLLYTDVWILRDGRWQCVSSQSTRVQG